jgi:hypothetical protein
MAGHRRATGQPRRADRQAEHWRTRISGCTDARQQFAAMADLVLTRAKNSSRPAELLNAASHALAEVMGRQA